MGIPLEDILKRIDIRCLELNYTFQGFVGEYSGVRTKLNLSCNSHGDKWSTTDTNHLSTRSGKFCPTCNKEFTISRFKKDWVGRTKGSLTIVAEHGKKVEITCSVCIKDKELFPENFKTLKDSFNKGYLPCGCNKGYSKTPQQYKLLCQRKELTLEGITFLGFKDKDEDVRYSGHIILACEKHGMWDTSRIENFLVKTNSDCPKCTEERDRFGLYRHKADETDFLYLLKFENKNNPQDVFIKIGRTFHTKRRINSFPKCYDISEIKLINDSHINIHAKEQQIHKEYKEFHVKPLILFGGDTECYHASILECVELIKTFGL